MRLEEGEKIVLLSVITNLILVTIKLGLSFLPGSVALVADAIHSSSDVIASGTVLAGLKISKR